MESSRSPIALPVLILGLILLVYLVTMPVEYARGDPAAEHSLASSPDARADRLVRPNHLLTAPLNRLVLQAVPAGSYRAGLIALELLQVLAAFLAAVGLWRLARRVAPEASPVLPALLILFFLAYGVWRHAITIETGMVPLALLIASIWIFEAGDRASTGRTAAASAVFSLGVLFAFNQVLLAPAFLVLVAMRRPAGRAAHLLAAAGAMLLAGAVPYVVLAAGLLGIRSPAGFFAWLTDHPDKESLAHLSIGLGSIFRSLSGFLNLLVDLRGAPTFVRLLLSGGGGGSLDPLLAGRLAAGACLFGGLLVLALIGSRGDRALAASGWLAAAATLLFGIVWLGSDPQFWLPAWPFLFLLAVRGAATLERSRWRGWVRGAAWVAAAALPVLNLPVFGPSLLVPAGGPEDRTAREMAPLFQPGDLLLYPSATHGDSWVSPLHHLRGDIRVVSLADRKTFGEARAAGFRDALARWIDEQRREGRQVFVDGLVGPVRPEQIGPWEVVKSFRGWSRADLRKLLAARYGLRLVRTRSGASIAVLGEAAPGDRR